MHAQVGECRDLAPEANHHKPLIEQVHRKRLVAKLRDATDGMPAPSECAMQSLLARDVEMDIGHGTQGRRGSSTRTVVLP